MERWRTTGYEWIYTGGGTTCSSIKLNAGWVNALLRRGSRFSPCIVAAFQIKREPLLFVSANHRIP